MSQEQQVDETVLDLTQTVPDVGVKAPQRDGGGGGAVGFDVLPIAGPLQKKRKFELSFPAGKDSMKWVETPAGAIPFVRNSSTGVVHCGHVRMDLYKNGSVVCLSGCGGIECPQSCTCYCHVLQSHYKSRYTL